MAVKTTTTKVLRHHMALRNGGTRYIDIDNPIDDTEQIKTNIQTLNYKLDPNDMAQFAGILVGNDFFDGDTDAVVTSCTSAEIIQTTKTVQTTDISF